MWLWKTFGLGWEDHGGMGFVGRRDGGESSIFCTRRRRDDVEGQGGERVFVLDVVEQTDLSSCDER